jgi:hypothetical protein
VPRDGPDERLRAELQRIDETNFEAPEQKVHERSFAISERLSLELPRLTDLAQVPSDPKARVPFDPERPGRFRGAVLDVVLDAWKNADVHAEALQLPSTHPALYRAVAALRSAKHALADLDERHREALWWPIAEAESGIDLFLGEEAERIKRRVHRRGRRAGTVKDRMFQIFVRDLLLATEACGGRLGFEKNIGKGRLVEAINILKPCLPKGFVPTPLPLSTLQRIKSQLAKRRRYKSDQ